MMAVTFYRAWLPLLAALASLNKEVGAFFVSPLSSRTASSSLSLSSATSTILQDTLENSLQKILQDHSSQVEDQDYQHDNIRARLRSYESEAIDISWLSALEITDNNNLLHIGLTCWNGPRLDPPHLLVSCTQQQNNQYDLRINFCPRAYAGWDDVRADGSFPEPNSRAAFYERQRRRDQMEDFFTPELQEWAKNSNYPQLPRQIPEGTSGPVRLEVTVPTVQEASTLIQQAVEVFCQWRENAIRSDSSVQAMQIYAFDCRTRPALTEMQQEHLNEILPTASFAATVGEASAGPPDLADRSAAMTAAAQTNFEIDHMVEATEKD